MKMENWRVDCWCEVCSKNIPKQCSALSPCSFSFHCLPVWSRTQCVSFSLSINRFATPVPFVCLVFFFFPAAPSLLLIGLFLFLLCLHVVLHCRDSIDAAISHSSSSQTLTLHSLLSCTAFSCFSFFYILFLAEQQQPWQLLSTWLQSSLFVRGRFESKLHAFTLHRCSCLFMLIAKRPLCVSESSLALYTHTATLFLFFVIGGSALCRDADDDDDNGVAQWKWIKKKLKREAKLSCYWLHCIDPSTHIHLHWVALSVSTRHHQHPSFVCARVS